MDKRWRAFRRMALVATVLLALLATAAPAASAQPRQGDPPGSRDNGQLQWRPCYQQLQQDVWPDDAAQFFGGPIRFECANYPVPLDHDGSDGGTIQIGMVRIPAANQAERIGSLFTNPGGPGGSGVEFTLFAGPTAFGGEIRERFDIVGFDPRGILLSTPARCYGNYRQAGDAFSQSPPPATDDEISTWLQSGAALREACAQKGRRIMDHMSTANVARDLDLLRSAVGDEQLSYVGFSYGTMIGSTYANLFPDNVRALALDSALDPVAWTTDDGRNFPATSRVGSHKGAQDSLDEFFRLCDEAGPGCPLAPNSAERYDAVVEALRAEPLLIEQVFPDPVTGELIVEQFEYKLSFLFADTVGILYGGDAWPIISFIVADLEAQLFGPPPPPVFQQAFAHDVQAFHAGDANSFETRAGLEWNRVPNYFNFLEGFPAVFCGETANPTSLDAWYTAAAALDATSYFGSFWTWNGSVCLDWPFSDEDAYTGPWDTPTANPILILNNEFDPATPLDGAIVLDSVLANSQLLTVVGGRGHIAVQGSSCAVAALEAYVVDLVMPPPGATCLPDLATPFLPPPPPPLLALIAPLDGVGDPIEVILILPPLPDLPPIALDLETGEPLNIDPETGEILPIEVIEILGPFEPPPPPDGPPPGDEPPLPVDEPPAP